MNNELVITRRRKKYKFAKFNEMENCYHFDEWLSLCHPELTLSSRAKPRDLVSGSRIIVEIGAGSALFLVQLAKLHPENLYIAVDIKSDRLYRGAKQAIEEKINNIKFIRSDIWRITELFNKNSVDEIWLTFCDPYPRKSDAKHRLTHPRFLDMYKTILRTGPTLTQLYFKTDNKGLFDWSLEQFEQTGWKIKEISRDLHNSKLPDEYKIMTTYEEKFANEGLPIYFAEFEISG